MTEKEKEPSSGTGPSGFPAVSAEQWRDKVEAELSGAAFESSLVSTDPAGLPVEPLYWLRPSTSEAVRLAVSPGSDSNTENPIYRSDLAPGQIPWSICALHADTDLRAVNRAILDDLEGGCDALWLRLGQGRSGPSLWGGPGIPVSTLDDLDRLLEGVALDLIDVLLEPGGEVLPAAGLLVALVRRRGLDPARMRLELGADPLGHLASSGELPRSLNDHQREVAQLVRYCRESLPASRALTLSSLPYHCAGASVPLELALLLAAGVEALRWLDADGLSLSDAAAQIGWRLALSRDVLTAVASLRAARVLWGRALAACGLAEAPRLVLHAVTSPRTQTVRDPHLNLLRETTQSFAAVVGGSDRVTVLPYDSALGSSHGMGRRLARNIQSILGEESHLGWVRDPAAGSYFIESRTEQLAERAWALFQEIEAEGGLAATLASGSLAKRLAQDASDWLDRVSRRKAVVVGVSAYARIEEPGDDEPKVSAESEAVSAQARQSSEALGTDFESLVAAATESSLAEIARSLPTTGSAVRVERLPVHRDASSFEALQDRSDQLARQGLRPRVLLVKLGSRKEHNARVAFAVDFFAAGGIEVSETADGLFGEVLAVTEAAAALVGQQGAPVVCLCGSDTTYAQYARAVASRLHQEGVSRLLLAGRGGDLAEGLQAHGVTDFLYQGCDAVELLESLIAACEEQAGDSE